MQPVMAVAAAVAGLTRCIMPPLPIRPLKFRFVVDAQTSPSANMPLLMPRQAPQVGFVTQNPESMNVCKMPSSIAWLKTLGVAGETMPRTESLIFFPLSTRAATRRSSILPLVHDPM